MNDFDGPLTSRPTMRRDLVEMRGEPDAYICVPLKLVYDQLSAKLKAFPSVTDYYLILMLTC